ncbi:MAG: 5-oxoprolinase subunit PxpA [Chitinophagaceae bacterium]
MHFIDLNCDMGEGMGHDAALFPYISSASIACGYHAGDESIMRQTMLLAAASGVAIGAHVSFADRDNFGRTEMHLPAKEVYRIVVQQLILAGAIAADLQLQLRHVKPHGALYNQSAKDPVMAQAIAAAIRDVDAQLILFGLSGSASIDAAKAAGLRTAGEVFADRAYSDDGALVPRSQPGALINDKVQVVQQALQMIQTGTVTSRNGKMVPVIADTICLHGDGEQAVAFAQTIHASFKQQGIEIKAS